MENWKAVRAVNLSETAVKELPPTNLTGPVDQHDFDEHLHEHDRRLSEERRQRRPRLSIAENDDTDWPEHDAALRNAKEMAHTLMEKECAANDVIRVWELISKFITFKLMEGQAVKIAGLGTFTYHLHKTPMNQKAMKTTKAPIFILSEYVAKMYCLIQEKVFISNTKVVPLNMSVIANDAKLPRGMIDGILTEILQAFARAVICNKAVELPFPFIGKLQIRDRKVTMKFYDEFCKKLGFHVVQTSSEQNILENMISGRMTPLSFHIPTETFRSVFHLREVRSVHEFPLAIPIIRRHGRLIPETMIDPEDPFDSSDTEEDGIFSDSSIIIASSSSCSSSNSTVSRAPVKILPYTKPLYLPQKTGDCVLDLMLSCPQVMNHCLRSNVYKNFVETLGEEVVKSHLRRKRPSANNKPNEEEKDFRNDSECTTAPFGV